MAFISSNFIFVLIMMLKPIIHNEQSYIIIWSDIAVSYINLGSH